MANSIRYNDLKSRLNQLEVHLLPRVDPSLNYNEKDRDLIRAYCLLSHAEIENYFEDIIWEITTKAINKWSSDKTIISPIIFHLAFSYKQEPGKQKEQPYSMVMKSYKNLDKLIKKNNGIKDDNLNSLLKPIGFEIDPTLQSTLNNFGSNRGLIAHNSFQAHQALDPVSEKTNVNLILIGIKDFDEELISYELNGTKNRNPIKIKRKKFKLFQIIKQRFVRK